MCGRRTEVKVGSAPGDDLEDAQQKRQAQHGHQAHRLELVEDEQLHASHARKRDTHVTVNDSRGEGQRRARQRRGGGTERVCLLKPNCCSMTKVE